MTLQTMKFCWFSGGNWALEMMPLAGTGRTVFWNRSRIANPRPSGTTWKALPEVPSVANCAPQ